MTRPNRAMHPTRWLMPLFLLAGAYACGSSSSPGVNGNLNGAKCSIAADCVSGVCMNGTCEGNGKGAPANSQCTSNAQCASLSCSPTSGTCNSGTQLASGQSCASPTECQSGLTCISGVCGSSSPSGGAGYGGNGSVSTGTPPFQGDPSFIPLASGCDPTTAHECVPCTHSSGVAPTATVQRPPAFLCFGADSSKGVADPTPNDPAAIIEQIVETVNGQSYVHIRITFDPAFVDNTYGANASAGWFGTANGKTGKGHTFSDDLTGSDHLDLLLTDGAGNTVMELGEDYITSLTNTGGPKPPGGGPGGPGGPGAKGTGGTSGTGGAASTGPTTGCGYTTLGVLGGDGYMTTGSANYVIGAATSMDRDLNCGYCESSACAGADAGTGDCTVNSPKTDASYTPNPLTPKWNYDVVYEVWIDTAAFGSAGFGQAFIQYVHASPSKITGTNTLYVTPTPCPPSIGHCTAGQDCWVGPDGGVPPKSDGGTSVCEQNFQMYVTLEGVASCTPIPYANYPNHEACPTGYTLDTASEGRYCLPSK